MKNNQSIIKRMFDELMREEYFLLFMQFVVVCIYIAYMYYLLK